MAKTIGNPLSWFAGSVTGTASHLGSMTSQIGGTEADTIPQIRKITTADIRDALKAGFADFSALRTDVMFLCLIYPLIGVGLALLAFQGNLLQMLFPVLAGFALVGPFAAVGLYEMSRRREMGDDVNWGAAFKVINSPRFGAIIMLGAFHLLIFGMWLMAANFIYVTTMGSAPPTSMGVFVQNVLTTNAGQTLLIVGTAVGFVFATAVLACSVVSFPLLLDRNVGLPIAVKTSVRVTRRNPYTVTVWGVIVATTLALGTLPMLLGLVIVLPVLGHATWHLYRKAVG